ncbi:MAG: radical SAM family heme chaperone HemW, partial [Planctomycetia bacterium]
MTAPTSSYIHVPFCAHKCGYCDFASVAGMDERMADYLVALDLEMTSLLVEPTPVRTLFIGGGTPTYLSADLLDRLLTRVNHWHPPGAVEEFTVEANPNTLTAEKSAVLADHGVNRVSLGAQSFHPHLLERLERDHDPDSVPRGLELLRPRIDNVSLDLIFGVPGQTFAEWEYDLRRVVELQPDHCSTYGLTFEKGTRLYEQRRLGVVQSVDEEIERRMFEHALDALGVGWEHYEISNHARRRAFPDGSTAARPCMHNLVYWANDPCFGFGTGAAAYVDGVRTLNT